MADKLIDFVGEGLRNYASLDETIQNLERNIDVLLNRAADMMAMTRESELHSGKKRKREVEEWLREVERKKEEFEILKEEFLQAGWYARIQLVRRADTMIAEIAGLRQQSVGFGGLLIDGHDTKVIPLVATEWKGRVFEENLNEIWAWLMDDEILSIGIYGMAGVGKTTLAECIHNNLLNETKFLGAVYWITVSEEGNIPKLQKDIGKFLNLVLSSEDDERRAARLSQALKRKEKFVIILDDVWVHFEVEKMGINLEAGKSKLIVTSRSLDVCRRIGCQKEIKVKPLSEEEAWKLFMKKLGCQSLPLDVQVTAKSMAQKCAGLPLAIISVAGSMKGVDDIHEWRDALEELEEHCVGHDDDKVFQTLKFSFNHLRDQRLKDCFLYCSLYPEDYRLPREELIRRFIVEGLMVRRGRRQAEFDQGHALLNRLENVCLLEPTVGICENDFEICENDFGICENDHSEAKWVKMHDLNREMALKITKTDAPKYMVKSGFRLTVIPDESEWKEDLDKVSLMNNRISLIPSGISPKCLKLSTLILAGNRLRLIPDSFFAHLGTLRVLDLSDNHDLEELPNCISDMENLTALLLFSCPRLRFVPPLGKLKALKELDMHCTAIKNVPEGLERLVNLKCLDMGTTELKIVPEGILPKLSSLQSLRIPGCVQVLIEELKTLRRLEEFQGGFANMDTSSQFVRFCQSFDWPCSYFIQVGLPRDRLPGLRNLGGTINKRIILNRVVLGRRGGGRTILLPGDVQEIKMISCSKLGKSLADVLSRLNIQGQGLSDCEIESCEEIECILQVSSSGKGFAVESQISPLAPLQSLKHLRLSGLPNFVGLLQCVLVPELTPVLGTFSCLESLHLCRCDKLKKIFTPRLLQHLQNLQVIHVETCDKLEELIGEDEGDDVDLIPSSSDQLSRIAHVSLPKTKVFRLHHLTELKSICKGTITCDSIERIDVENCHKLRRFPFLLPTINGHLSPPPNLKVINLPDGELGQWWWESLQWDDATTKKVLKPFVRYHEYL